MRKNKDQIVKAINLASRGEWDDAHNIVQDFSDPIACWIHAVLHKIEGDAWNSRYWYARSEHSYEEFSDPLQELKYIASCLEAE